MMAGKWQKYTEKYGDYYGDLLNEHMRQVLKTGVRVLLKDTQQDSGTAAYHWTVVPNKTDKVRPGAWAQSKFTPMHGRPPVGARFSGGKNAQQVIKAVIDREWSRSISRAISGRNPSSTFAFRNTTPETNDDSFEGHNYRDNAELKRASDNALLAMRQKHNAMSARGFRKNPIG